MSLLLRVPADRSRSSSALEARIVGRKVERREWSVDGSGREGRARCGARRVVGEISDPEEDERESDSESDWVSLLSSLSSEDELWEVEDVESDESDEVSDDLEGAGDIYFFMTLR